MRIVAPSPSNTCRVCACRGTGEFTQKVDWQHDDSCGDVDVLELLDLVAHKTPTALRGAIEACIEDGAIHLRPVLDLPHGEMGAAFFLELLEAAAKEGFALAA